MKKFIYIASLAAFTLIVGCEKEEFEFVATAENTPQLSESGFIEDDNGGSKGGSHCTPKSESEKGNIGNSGGGEKDDDISIKEVSDGDDEADGGDDSKKKN